MDNPALIQTVEAAAKGDEQAFEALFRAHQNAVYSLAMHFARDRELAADLTQDAFVRAWEKLPKLREPEAFAGWLRALTLNIVRDHFRRARETEPLDETFEVADEGPGPDEQASGSEQERAVRRAILTLPEHQRTPIVMYHLEGRPVEEVAEALGVPKNTVVSRLARGRAALRRRLGGHLEENEEG